ncbi:pimelyl-ACP methyl ester esterase BioV [Hydrogenimonas sp. SS33]|uniref:pimelyl-ACP methyl ester esterase BioV n=1 Tax=Hydrogenimonas leucolamina TaxID=2954236 RepID=UPI00336BF759
MTFFSGFSLRGEAALFEAYLGPWRENPYVVAGFSYGAVKAVEYAISHRGRIDRLLLLSPAWFVDKSTAFKRAQLLAFRKDRDRYLKAFFRNALHPSSLDLTPYIAPGDIGELEELLMYEWPRENFEKIRKKGIVTEIYLGREDRIVDANAAHDYFRNVGESWLFKPYGHFLS